MHVVCQYESMADPKDKAFSLITKAEERIYAKLVWSDGGYSLSLWTEFPHKGLVIKCDALREFLANPVELKKLAAANGASLAQVSGRLWFSCVEGEATEIHEIDRESFEAQFRAAEVLGYSESQRTHAQGVIDGTALTITRFGDDLSFSVYGDENFLRLSIKETLNFLGSKLRTKKGDVLWNDGYYLRIEANSYFPQGRRFVTTYALGAAMNVLGAKS